MDSVTGLPDHIDNSSSPMLCIQILRGVAFSPSASPIEVDELFLFRPTAHHISEVGLHLKCCLIVMQDYLNTSDWCVCTWCIRGTEYLCKLIRINYRSRPIYIHYKMPHLDSLATPEV